MNESFLDLLKRLAPAEPPAQLEATARELDTLTGIFAEVVARLADPNAQREIASHLSTAALARLADGTVPAPITKLTPELLEWARGLDTEEEIVAGIREVYETGGLELKDFIQEIIDITSSNG
jgi:hypothetical protein